MKIMSKRLAIFFVAMIFSGSIGAMTMRMAPAPYKEKEEDSYAKRQRLKALRKSNVRDIETARFIERLLQQVQKNELPSLYLTNCSTDAGYFNALKWAIDKSDDVLLLDLLTADADSNYGHPKPLEYATRKKVIELLLQFKADPKLCTESVLVKPLLYYLDRDNDGKREGVNSWDHSAKYEAIHQERVRLMEKAHTVISMLLKKGANANAMSMNQYPLPELIELVKKHYIAPNETTYSVIKKLIWAGAHPGLPVAQRLNPWEYDRRFAYAFDSYMWQERYKHQAIRLLLIGNRDRGSCLCWLPRELLREIGILVKNGFEFNFIKIQEPAPVPAIQQPIAPEKKQQALVVFVQHAQQEIVQNQNAQPNEVVQLIELPNETEDVEIPELIELLPEELPQVDKSLPTSTKSVEPVELLEAIEQPNRIDNKEVPERLIEQDPFYDAENRPDDIPFTWANRIRSQLLSRKSLPFVVIGAASTLYYYNVKRHKKKKRAAEKKKATIARTVIA